MFFLPGWESQQFQAFDARPHPMLTLIGVVTMPVLEVGLLMSCSSAEPRLPFQSAFCSQVVFSVGNKLFSLWEMLVVY